MGSVIDKIVPIASTLDHPFTAREMAEKIYGDTNYHHVQNMHGKIRRLVKQGQIIEVERVFVHSQWMVSYKVIQ